ncbi:unnamed protein product [Blepharisma stoltei]|uniref:Uncharacterized protein n=1 Tax=Blepharisma stoltei TaxID=1481888 RepID=A0AAU9J356_9CILI|nr:unnamed protein product [Blepharisma stoltei]
MAEYNDYSFYKHFERALTPGSMAIHQKNSSKVSFSSFRMGSPIKFQYLNIRPRSSYVTAPSTKRIAPPDSTSSHLGPGRYNHEVHDSGPSFEFSRDARFQERTNFSYDISHLLKHKQPSEAISKRIEENKDLRQYEPRKKLERAKSLSQRRKTRGDIAKQTKYCILQSIKTERKDRLDEKFKKFELRMRKNEVFQVRLSWISVISLFGSATIMRYKLKKKIILRRRVMSSLKWLRQISKCVGKFVILGKKIRRLRANRILRIYMLIHVKRWLKNRRQRNLNTIINVFESSITSSVMLKTMFKWQQKLYTIQRGLKKFILIKRTLYDIWVERWNEAENEIFEKSSARKTKKKKTHKKSKKAGTTSIPEEIKQIYIRNYIRKQVKKYNEEYQTYVAEVKALNLHIETQLKKVSAWDDSELNFPDRPQPPNISLELTKELLIEMIHTAERERTKWSQLKEGEQRKITISKKNEIKRK